jgi:hypothetical protein
MEEEIICTRAQQNVHMWLHVACIATITLFKRPCMTVVGVYCNHHTVQTSVHDSLGVHSFATITLFTAATDQQANRA